MNEYTRESWLEHAIEIFRPRFAGITFPIPKRLHVSVGFAFGARRENAQVLGQCWRREASDDGINHVFISPEIGDTFDVLETLLHELIHAADNCESGHKGSFKRAALALGLMAPMTYTPASPEVQAELITIAAELGDYPHGKLRPGGTLVTNNPELFGTGVKLQSGPAKQKTYLIKLQCPACGYTVRTTRTWLSQGVPSCHDGTKMQEAV